MSKEALKTYLNTSDYVNDLQALRMEIVVFGKDYFLVNYGKHPLSESVIAWFESDTQ